MIFLADIYLTQFKLKCIIKIQYYRIYFMYLLNEYKDS